MLGFDLLAIIPSLFSRVFNLLSISKKSSKIKFLEKFWKNLLKFLCQKWGREAPRRPQGDPPCHPTIGGRGPSLAAPWHGEGGPLALHFHFTLSPKISQHSCSNPSSCCYSSQFFDLLAQPIFGAEIWSNCSPVCDSSDCPSRILFGGVFLEYFSTIGVRINEFACLFYCLEMLF
jgi:hypothetical protein